MRVFEMVGVAVETTPTVSTPARSRMCGQLCLLGIGAPEAGEVCLAAEAGEVHGDIGSAAGSRVALGVAEDGDRSLGRDAVHLADDVAIEHEVAYDKNFEALKPPSRRFRIAWRSGSIDRGQAPCPSIIAPPGRRSG